MSCWRLKLFITFQRGQCKDCAPEPVQASTKDVVVKTMKFFSIIGFCTISILYFETDSSFRNPFYSLILAIVFSNNEKCWTEKQNWMSEYLMLLMPFMFCSMIQWLCKSSPTWLVKSTCLFQTYTFSKLYICHIFILCVTTAFFLWLTMSPLESSQKVFATENVSTQFSICRKQEIWYLNPLFLK